MASQHLGELLVQGLPWLAWLPALGLAVMLLALELSCRRAPALELPQASPCLMAPLSWLPPQSQPPLG